MATRYRCGCLDLCINMEGNMEKMDGKSMDTIDKKMYCITYIKKS